MTFLVSGGRTQIRGSLCFTLLAGLVLAPACSGKSGSSGKRDRKGTVAEKEQTVAKKRAELIRKNKIKRPLRPIRKPEPSLRQPSDWKLDPGGLTDVELLAKGDNLWKDTKLGLSGMSCQMCHSSAARFRPSFAQDYPHKVIMAWKNFKIPVVTAAEMVQVCMTQTMSARRLDWKDPRLHALTRSVLQRQNAYRRLSRDEREKRGMEAPVEEKEENQPPPPKSLKEGAAGDKG